MVLAPLVPETDDDYQRNGNTLLNDLFGARVHVLGQGETAADFARRRAEDLTAQGRRPYLTPGGGSSSISALGYVRCALELDTQLNSNGLDDAIIVTANGSNGTHAGLLAGFKAVELQFPYDHAPATVKSALERHRLTMLGINTAPGQMQSGEFGLAAVPGRSTASMRMSVIGAVTSGEANYV